MRRYPVWRVFGINRDDVVLPVRELGLWLGADDDDVLLREDEGIAMLIDATLLFLTGMVLIGRGGLMKYAELAPVGPPSDNLFVSATTLRKAGLLIASTSGNISTRLPEARGSATVLTWINSWLASNRWQILGKHCLALI